MATTYKIVRGISTDDGHTRVWRVVEYTDGVCRGGVGSYFRPEDAIAFVNAHKA